MLTRRSRLATALPEMGTCVPHDGSPLQYCRESNRPVVPKQVFEPCPWLDPLCDFGQVTAPLCAMVLSTEEQEDGLGYPEESFQG